MGDILLASPVADAIRARHPNAHISWLVQSEFESLLEGHPNIDELILWDKARWVDLLKKRRFIQLARAVLDFRRTLRSKGIDLTLDLQGLMKTGFLSWLSGAKTRVGLGSREGNTLFMTRTISRNLADQSQVGAEYRYFANQLGYPEQSWDMYIPLTNKARTDMHRLLDDKIQQDAYAIICPFSLRPQNRWFDEYWEQVILRIRGRYQLRTIILGGEQDREAAEEIARTSGAINLSGATSFQESSALIQNCSLLIGVDTGLTHIGHALKVPSISLFGSTNPYTHTGHDSSTVIYLDRFCSPCARQPTCKGQFQCMREITPDTVLSEIKTLMKNFHETRIKHVL